jgi:hypothetical protein
MVSQSLNEKRDLHVSEEVYQIGSGFSRGIRISAHSSRRLLTLGPKICSLFTLFTTSGER